MTKLILYAVAALVFGGSVWLALHWHAELARAEGKIAALEAAAKTHERDMERSADLSRHLSQTIRETANKVVTVTEKIYATPTSTVCDSLPPYAIANDFVFDLINSGGRKEKAGVKPAPAVPPASSNPSRRDR